jgi:hypothetical protein
MRNMIPSAKSQWEQGCSSSPRQGFLGKLVSGKFREIRNDQSIKIELIYKL